MQEYWQTSILDTCIEVKKLPLRHIQNPGSGWQADIHNSTLGLHRLTQIAIATALGRAMTDNSVARGLKYLDRMPTEMRVMAMRDAAARDTAITHTPEFVRFGVQSEAIR